METSRWVWTFLLLGLGFTGSIRGLPEQTSIDCETPQNQDLSSIPEEYKGVVEFVNIPRGAEIFLESPSCPECVSFLQLNYTVGDALASVITQKPLDAEALKPNGHLVSFSYSISCKSGIRNDRTLVLNDINDNAPVFDKDMYTVNVSEAKPVNTEVTHIKAVDADVSSLYSHVSYSIEPTTTTFEIRPDGSIMLKKELDYTTSKVYNFTVKAEDIERKTGETTVIINVLATPGPAFEHDNYNAMMREHEVGPVLSIHPAPIWAYCKDQKIIYNITEVSPGEFWGNLAIENETGVITVKKELDREKASMINLVIMASLKNDGKKTAVATVEVNVVDMNEPPVFNPEVYRAEIFSVVPAGYPVMEVKATDPDVGETLSYSLVEPSSMFAVEPSSGQVYVVSVAGLSRNVTLQVKVEDQHGLYDTSTVEVTIHYCEENNVVKISLNMPYDSVMNKSMEMKTALESALSWDVRIIRISGDKARNLPLSRSSTHQTYVDFIALTQNNVIMPKDDVETRLNNEKQKVLTELQAVFGPDVDYDIMGDVAPSWPTIVAVTLGVVGALAGISLTVFGVVRKRHRRRKSIDSMEDNPNF
ncbi:hypothetical protein AALO_G00098410 [Alosa alosa]|uniref:Cadherin domain-containing protein n=1 Tax=Alosa alosa TaxID=278164 RepID=A0AAV6GTV7_9TELE|nr:protein dachsous-like [Alosa alosa]KAG5278385.1 hypothetical protein AALO_G00098410 [Alosa alosa]